MFTKKFVKRSFTFKFYVRVCSCNNPFIDTRIVFQIGYLKIWLYGYLLMYSGYVNIPVKINMQQTQFNIIKL